MRTAPVLMAAILFLATAPVGGVAVAQNQRVTLTVAVVTPLDEPVADATLTVTWADGSTTETTAANGKAFIDVPAGANVSIAVEHPQYVRNNPVTVTDADERTVTITVYPKTTATVRLTDEDGEPIEGATVQLYKRGRLVVNGTTDPDGRLASGTIETGEYRVVARKPGYYTRNLTRRTAGETWNVTMERGFVTVTFDVSDDHFSPPRALANATIRGPEIGSVRTQSNGRQSVSVPVNTVVEVTVTKPGYRSRSREIRVGESDVTAAFTTRRIPALEVDVLADRVVVGEPLLVEATDEYGAPVANATVLLDGSAVAETDADGRAIVLIESSGNHTVELRKGGLDSARVNVTGVLPRTATAGSPTTTAPATGTEPPPTEDGADGPVPGLPGFGVPAAALALLLVAFLMRGER